MIGQLRGVLAEKKPPFLIIDVHGVGYEVQASMTTIYGLPAVGTSIFLYIHFVVREDAQLLYGFATERERIVFRELIKISGVGPKLALAILSGMDLSNLMQCVNDRDAARLTKIPGVGKKTAERLIIEMKDSKFSDIVLASANTSATSAEQDAVSALVALGYKQADAQTRVRKVYTDAAGSETLIRLALQAAAK
jgi:Holliday junction DNA helicase RuvA